MVHIFCQNGECRTLIHLSDQTHWNFKGKVKCTRCGKIMEIETKNGKILYVKETNIIA